MLNTTIICGPRYVLLGRVFVYRGTEPRRQKHVTRPARSHDIRSQRQLSCCRLRPRRFVIVVLGRNKVQRFGITVVAACEHEDSVLGNFGAHDRGFAAAHLFIERRQPPKAPTGRQLPKRACITELRRGEDKAESAADRGTVARDLVGPRSASRARGRSARAKRRDNDAAVDAGGDEHVTRSVVSNGRPDSHVKERDHWKFKARDETQK